MRAIDCQKAERWLQAPAELGGRDARRLDAHLTTCSACREARAEWEDVDALIQESLSVRMPTESVRGRVLTRLQEEAVSPSSPERRQPRRIDALLHWLTVPRPPMVRATVRLGLAVAAAAFVLSQLPLNNAGAPRAVRAIGWRVPRSDISFPLAVDPARPNHLLAGAQGQVYQSWNAGVSWTHLAPLPPRMIIRGVAVDPSHPRRYLVAVLHSVFVSNDAGRHWTETASGLTGAMNMFVIPDAAHPGTIYLGPSILWKSVNHGDTWEPAGPGRVFAPGGIQGLAVAPDGRLYTGIWGGGVAVSTDGGLSWRRRAHGLAPDVMDVETGYRGTVWAATNRGVYRSTNGGRSWHRVTIPFWATSVLVRPGYLLVAGRQWVYRSTNGGRSWTVSMDNLPLNPYVHDLLGDPFNPQRVYASLNGDGLFESNDGGLHWSAVDAGLPLNAARSAVPLVLFRRFGALWLTDTNGTDPGSISVDTDVAHAALAPDGTAAGYVADWGSGWALNLLTAPDPKLHLLTSELHLDSGPAPAPTALLWSPDSSLLAAVRPRAVIVAATHGGIHSWPISAREHVLGWAADGHGLLVWNGATGTISERGVTDGHVSAGFNGVRYPAAPVVAPNGSTLAGIWQGELHIGSVGRTAQAVGRVSRMCHVEAWSRSSVRVLLTCGRVVQERDLRGRLVATTWASGHVIWAPGSDRALLIFRNGSLWSWVPGRQPRKLVANAAAAS